MTKCQVPWGIFLTHTVEGYAYFTGADLSWDVKNYTSSHRHF